MTAAAVEFSGIRRASPSRRFVVFVAALAFALQAYITQTHNHDALQGGGIVKIATGQAPGKTAPHDRRADCPFCQAMIHAGAFVASAVPSLLLPFVWVQTTTPVFAPRLVAGALAHDWQSRAPPRR
jgi:hypothetical protein